MTPNILERSKLAQKSNHNILGVKSWAKDYKINDNKSQISDESWDRVVFEQESSEKPIQSDISGSENINERMSDLYSRENISNRIPRISSFAEKGATNCK